MTRSRTFFYAALALGIAFVGHWYWSTLFNPLVWHLTYIGVHVARAIHQPDYDSLASARIFDSLAILCNAVIYFGVLVALDRLLAQRRSRRAVRHE